MRARAFALVAGAASTVAFAAACVDLFHATDFTTLCTKSPADPACGGDAGVDAAPAEAAAEDSAPPAIDFCAWTSDEARSQAERACAYLGACLGPHGESVFGACVIRAQLAFDCTANPYLRPTGAPMAFWQCMATATTCSAIEACAFGGPAQGCPTIASGKFTRCTSVGGGHTRIECSAPGGKAASAVEPCVMTSRTCTDENASVSNCTGALRATGCTESGCVGTNAVECDLGGGTNIDRGVDCAGMGAGRCVAEDAGPTCAPNASAPACSGDPTPACASGSTVSSCVGGRRITINCAKLGLVCDDRDPIPLTDVAQGCKRIFAAEECTGGDLCNGTKLTSCTRGGQFAVDCAKVGLGACQILPSGRGACAPPP